MTKNSLIVRFTTNELCKFDLNRRQPNTRIFRKSQTHSLTWIGHGLLPQTRYELNEWEPQIMWKKKKKRNTNDTKRWKREDKIKQKNCNKSFWSNVLPSPILFDITAIVYALRFLFGIHSRLLLFWCACYALVVYHKSTHADRPTFSLFFVFHRFGWLTLRLRECETTKSHERNEAETKLNDDQIYEYDNDFDEIIGVTHYNSIPFERVCLWCVFISVFCCVFLFLFIFDRQRYPNGEMKTVEEFQLKLWSNGVMLPWHDIESTDR